MARAWPRAAQQQISKLASWLLLLQHNTHLVNFALYLSPLFLIIASIKIAGLFSNMLPCALLSVAIFLLSHLIVNIRNSNNFGVLVMVSVYYLINDIFMYIPVGTSTLAFAVASVFYQSVARVYKDNISFKYYILFGLIFFGIIFLSQLLIAETLTVYSFIYQICFYLLCCYLIFSAIERSTNLSALGKMSGKKRKY